MLQRFFIYLVTAASCYSFGQEVELGAFEVAAAVGNPQDQGSW
jgi:hypothetical protein